MADQSPITVRNAPHRYRYELVDDGRVIGVAEYRPFGTAAGPQRILYHTAVDEAYAGQGLGGRLARFALDDTLAAGLTPVVVCPYIQAWLRRHPDYDGRLAPVRPEHLAAVPVGERTE